MRFVWSPTLPTWIWLATCTPFACSLVVSDELDSKPVAHQDPSGGQDSGGPDDAGQKPDVVMDAGAALDAYDADSECDACALSTACCGGRCINTMNDPLNCGGCGKTCMAGRVCESGACKGGWVAMQAPAQAFAARKMACAVWTGRWMFVWGGEDALAQPLGDGALYDPLRDAWLEVPTAGAPSPRYKPTCVATSSGVFVWGGTDGASLLDTGSFYDPVQNQWEPLGSHGVSPPRLVPVALWTGTEVLIWGGEKLDNNQEKSGRRYNPATKSWTTMSVGSCPPQNKGLIAAWTGDQLLVFGGRGNNAEDGFFSYAPASDKWQDLSSTAGLARRSHGFAAWVDNRMTIWGGLDDQQLPMHDGAAFDATVRGWVPLPPVGALTARALIPFVGGWSARAGDRLLVIGGGGATAIRQNGAVYAPKEPARQQWSTIPSWDPPGEHREGVGVWTETEFIVWGGWNGSEPMVGGSRWMP
ncbi:MAG: hypothetical protein MUF54_03935 [Polyangiaceae bacterium]|jgi:hypothetical protein|nr:hypothetical protein [Polyangiaceae bacterium]